MKSIFISKKKITSVIGVNVLDKFIASDLIII